MIPLLNQGPVDDEQDKHHTPSIKNQLKMSMTSFMDSEIPSPPLPQDQLMTNIGSFWTQTSHPPLPPRQVNDRQDTPRPPPPLQYQLVKNTPSFVDSDTAPPLLSLKDQLDDDRQVSPDSEQLPFFSPIPQGPADERDVAHSSVNDLRWPSTALKSFVYGIWLCASQQPPVRPRSLRTLMVSAV